MNYFRCGGSEKVTIDGVKVRDKLELVTRNADVLMLNNSIALQYPVAVVLNDEIHIITTNKNHYKWNGSMEIIDSYPFSTSADSMNAVVLNDEIYVLSKNILGKWDGETWTQVSMLPWTDCASAVVLNGEIHALGSISQSPYTFHYKWDGNTWTQVSTLPYQLVNNRHAVVLNDEIYIADGGQNSHNAFYKWDGKTWTRLTNVPYVFMAGGMVVLDDEIHVIGGAATSGGTANPHVQHYKWDGSAWIREKYISRGISYSGISASAIGYIYGAIVAYKGNIYLIGGSADDSKLCFTVLNARLYL